MKAHTRYLSVGLATLLIGLAAPLAAQAQDATSPFENLVRIDTSDVAVAYIDPNADFNVFNRVDRICGPSPIEKNQ